MAHWVATAEGQAEMLKERGNTYFKKERLGAAIDAYTEAITLCPSVPVYWTNRAVCHRKRKEWARVESDCRKALALDSNSVKAHHMLGLALLNSQLYGEAIKQLEKALELGRGGKAGSHLVEEIWHELAKARYTEWEQGATSRTQRQQDLKEACESLLKENYQKQVDDAAKRSPASVDPLKIDLGVDLIETDSNSRISKVEQKKDETDGPTGLEASVGEQYSSRLQTLSDVFEKAAASDRPAEVPDYLQCKITMDIFRDPVITPSGVTYERAVLLEHLRKVGKFDPLTRTPLLPEQIAPNLAIKEAVQAYLAQNGWAYGPF